MSDGTITKIETCFSGHSIVMPRKEGADQVPDDADVPHDLLERSDSACAWRSLTKGNPTVRHAATQAISVEIDAPQKASIVVEVNDHK